MIKHLRTDSGNRNVYGYCSDLSSLAGVKELAAHVSKGKLPLLYACVSRILNLEYKYMFLWPLIYKILSGSFVILQTCINFSVGSFIAL